MNVQEIKDKIERYGDELYEDVKAVFNIGDFVYIEKGNGKYWAEVVMHGLNAQSLKVQNCETEKTYWIDIYYVQDVQKRRPDPTKDGN